MPEVYENSPVFRTPTSFDTPAGSRESTFKRRGTPGNNAFSQFIF